MAHPFKDKFVTFIGRPERCSTQAARDALAEVGGVFDERISTFTEYVVEFRHNGNTAKYKQALNDNYMGWLTLLNEKQFFDILEGRASPPEKPVDTYSALQVPTSDPDAAARRDATTWQKMLNQKRMKNMAKYGVSIPGGGTIKIDFRLLDKTRTILEYIRRNPDDWGYVITGTPSGSCEDCGKPVKVYIDDNNGTEVGRLCEGCYNKMMAELTGAVMPDNIPNHITVKDKRGKPHEFELEFMIFQSGMELIAREIGKTKRKAEVFSRLDGSYDTLQSLLVRRIKKMLNTTYMTADGSLIGMKAVGYIDWNRRRQEHDIVIDGKPYTWNELGKIISSFEGWNIKIEFGDIGVELDPD